MLSCWVKNRTWNLAKVLQWLSFSRKGKITQQFADSIYSNCDTQPFNQVFDIMTIEPLGVALGPPCQHFLVLAYLVEILKYLPLLSKFLDANYLSPKFLIRTTK